MSQAAVGAVAAVVLATRARDVRHLRRLVLAEDGSVDESLKIVVTAGAIFGYERLIARLLQRLKLTRMPSTLAAMLSLFAALRATRKICGRELPDKVAKILNPGVDFLGKWMGLFLAPPLVSLDASIKALPAYSGSVWASTASLLAVGWALTHAAAGAVASSLAPRRAVADKSASPAAPAAQAPAAQTTQAVVPKVSQDEAVRRAWVVIGSAAFLGASAGGGKSIRRLCQFSTTVASLAYGKLLPQSIQRIFHPLVVCAVSSNLASRFVGTEISPYFDNGVGMGDLFFKWLPAAVTGLGVRMYNTTDKWLEDPADFKTVLTTCSFSGCFSVLLTSALAIAPQSPLSVPHPLSLPLLHRSVMSALGIEGSQAIGPECDPKLAVASILITGCIGASLGNALLELCPAVFNASSPLVRGVAMGCSAHSIGTAGLITAADTDAAAISGASMCLAGTAHTIVLNLPTVVPIIRALARLPPLA